MENRGPRKSWWLLKNGKKLYYGGIFSVFLYILLLMILLPLLLRGKEFSSVCALVLAAIFLGIVAMVYVSSDFQNLHKAVERLPAGFVIEDINLIRAKVIIKDERARRYTVKFRRFWGETELRDFAEDPESYEIWTPLRRSVRYPEKNLHDYTDSEIKGTKLTLFLPRIGGWSKPSSSTVLDDNLINLVHLRFEDEARTISSLKSVKLIRKQGEPILLAKLTKNINRFQMEKVLDLLKTLMHEIEH